MKKFLCCLLALCLGVAVIGCRGERKEKRENKAAAGAAEKDKAADKDKPADEKKP